MPTDKSPRYRASDLIAFAEGLFRAAGSEPEKALSMAEHLVEADLMGHTTHGLAQIPRYLEEIEAGLMAKTGEPRVIADRGAAITWDGGTLPGIWLTDKALALASERARRHGLAAVAIGRGHHSGCLAVYLRKATEQNLMAIIASSDPSEATMAPLGGLAAVFTPDPIAFGIPTGGDPILVDISASITTNAMTGRLRREGGRYPGLWAQDAQGRATDDPAVMGASPPGTLLPTGGKDHGHKGYGLALAVEAPFRPHVSWGIFGVSLFVETAFGLPGLGRTAATALQRNDLPVIVGIVVFVTVVIVVMNLIADILFAVLDPRVKLQTKTA